MFFEGFEQGINGIRLALKLFCNMIFWHAVTSDCVALCRNKLLVKYLSSQDPLMQVLLFLSNLQQLLAIKFLLTCLTRFLDVLKLYLKSCHLCFRFISSAVLEICSADQMRIAEHDPQFLKEKRKSREKGAHLVVLKTILPEGLLPK